MKSNSNTRIYWLLALVLCGTILIWQCREATEPDLPPTPTEQLSVPTFDRDSAYAYVEKQVSFGPRVPNSAAHLATKNWLAGKLREFGWTVSEQGFEAKAYTGETLRATNIIAQSNPTAQRRLLLGAHWDSRHIADKDADASVQDQPILGADDGASGVGVLLEIARQIQQHPLPNLGVDIVLFDVEDHGYDERVDRPDDDDGTTWGMGSQYWGKHPHTDPKQYRWGILLDMVGSKDAEFGKEEISRQVAPKLVNDIWSLANRMGYGKYFIDREAGSVIDDHYFVMLNAGVPMIDIINQPGGRGFGDYHHTQADNMDVINARTLKAVGQVTLAAIYRHANGQL